MLFGAIVKDADFTGAIVTGTNLSDSTSRGFSRSQLYSTISYQDRNLVGIDLSRCSLSRWDFSGQDLTGARLRNSTILNADFTEATISGADFGSVHMLKPEQLYSTTSYQQGDLRGVGFSFNDLEGWNLAGQNLASTVSMVLS